MSYHPYPIHLRRTLSIPHLRKTEVPIAAQNTASRDVDIEMNSQPMSSNDAVSSATTEPEPEARTRSLADILDGKEDDESNGKENGDAKLMDEDEPETEAKEGYCVECEGM